MAGPSTWERCVVVREAHESKCIFAFGGFFFNLLQRCVQGHDYIHRDETMGIIRIELHKFVQSNNIIFKQLFIMVRSFFCFLQQHEVLLDLSNVIFSRLNLIF